ncbi:MAG: hypothetical protein QOK37_3506 [Thermoanaerobaculia bacterium]|jgi:hypothetical protein|nr:hypothetical protein [Thermoanaerobaculia bacterium]
MANVDGKWNLIIKSPMGDQSAVLTANAAGDTLTGTVANATETTSILDGKIDGDTLTWKTAVTVPMPMTLDFKATASGDTMSGTVTAGAFGSFPMSGTRA